MFENQNLLTTGNATAERCCVDIGLIEDFPSPRISGSPAATEYRHTDKGFGALARQAARTQTGIDGYLVTTHGCLDERALAVAGFLLPAQQPFAAVKVMCWSRCEG